MLTRKLFQEINKLAKLCLKEIKIISKEKRTFWILLTSHICAIKNKNNFLKIAQEVKTKSSYKATLRELKNSCSSFAVQSRLRTAKTFKVKKLS